MKETGFRCTNCEALSSGLFCSSCGQKKFQRQQFELHKALKDIFSEVSDVESSLGKTVRMLFLHPGKLTADFLAGKQKSYVTPVRLYLIIITINFLVYAVLEDYSLVNIEFLKNISQNVPWLHQAVEQGQLESELSNYAFFHQVNTRVNDTLPILLYFLIFVQALVLKAQFGRYDRYYIEHLVFALHFMSFGFARDIALLPVHFFSKEVAFAVSIITTIWYLLQSLRHVYDLKGRQLILHSLLHYFIFFLLFTLTITTAVFIAMG
jgi:hypothetical protein